MNEANTLPKTSDAETADAKGSSVQRLVSLRLLDLAKTMKSCAKDLRDGKMYAHAELQAERDANAHATEFWSTRILEELANAESDNETLELIAIGRRWKENSSLEAWFPITADRIMLLEASIRACGGEAATIVKQSAEICRLKDALAEIRDKADPYTHQIHWCRQVADDALKQANNHSTTSVA